MADKTKKAKMANRNIAAGNNAKAPADPNRYTAVDERGERVYRGVGLALVEAVRLASSLLTPAGIARVEADGSLTHGTVSFAGEVPVFASVAA